MRTYHRSYKLIQVSRLLKRDRVAELQGNSKAEVLAEMVGLLSKSLGGGTNPEELLKAILDREAKISTGVGVGIAIPHARLASVKEFAVAIGRCKNGVAYESFDEGLVHLIFMIVSPAQEYGRYLNIHAKIALLMSHEEFRNKLIGAKDSDEIFKLMKGK